MCTHVRVYIGVTRTVYMHTVYDRILYLYIYTKDRIYIQMANPLKTSPVLLSNEKRPPSPLSRKHAGKRSSVSCRFDWVGLMRNRVGNFTGST
jgi:hypothetical protein